MSYTQLGRRSSSNAKVFLQQAPQFCFSAARMTARHLLMSLVIGALNVEGLGLS